MAAPALRPARLVLGAARICEIQATRRHLLRFSAAVAGAVLGRVQAGSAGSPSKIHQAQHDEDEQEMTVPAMSLDDVFFS
jgi:hypothetical protein